MNVQLPPVLLYGFGALLVVFGTLRAVRLGWQRNDRRHKMWGLLWIGMGIFLIVSTIIKLPR